MQSTNGRVFGWGADLSPRNRPGIPRELKPPHPVGSPSWSDRPEPQTTKPMVALSRGITPVYATTTPERGISGVLRRAAYRVPDYKPRRWMMLLLADRIDVMEHTLGPLMTIVGGAAAVAAGVLALRAIRERIAA